MKNFKIIICLLLICSLLGGCVNHKNLKDLIIVEGMAVDNNDEEVELSVQSLNVGKSTGVEKPEGNMTVNSSGKGDTIIDAIGSISKSMSNEMFFGNNKIIMFGREVCEKDFEDKLDYFLRSSDSRLDVAVCMVDGRASEVLDSTEHDAHVPVENIVNLINTGQDIGESIYMVTEDLLNSYSDKTTDVSLPVLKLNKESETAQLRGIAVFSDNKLIKILDDEQTLGYSLIVGRLKNCIIEFENDKFGKIGVEITSQRSVKKAIIDDGKAKFFVEIKGELLINEMEKGISTELREEDMNYISEQAQNEINRLCKNVFNVCRDCGSDCFRVGEYLARDNAKAYNSLSDDWSDYYKNTDISVETSLKLKKISDNTLLD